MRRSGSMVSPAPVPVIAPLLTSIFHSPQSISARPFQVVWRGTRCSRAQQPSHAWSSICVLFIRGRCQKSPEGGQRVSLILQADGVHPPFVSLTFYAASDPSRLQQISFARTRSDAVVKRLDAEHYEEHRQRRIEHKSVYFTRVSRHALTLRIYPETTRYTNPLKQKFRAQRLAAESELNITFFFLGSSPVFTFETVADGPAVSAPRRTAVQMPDEYLPPNKILFLQNLPPNVSKDQLMALFSQ